MSAIKERRLEPRIRFSWPLWFGYDEDGELFRGKVVDLSRKSVSFTISEHHTPPLGRHVLTRFSYPRRLVDDFDMESYFFWAEVIRVQHAQPGFARVVLNLHRPLEADPEFTARHEQLAQTA